MSLLCKRSSVSITELRQASVFPGAARAKSATGITTVLLPLIARLWGGISEVGAFYFFLLLYPHSVRKPPAERNQFTKDSPTWHMGQGDEKRK
jgi:hypothetical protein